MFYIELEHSEWDVPRLQTAWQQLLTHDKARFKNKTIVPATRIISVIDCTRPSNNDPQQAVREQLLSGTLPEFISAGIAVKATQTTKAIRLHIACDSELMDAAQFTLWWRQWQAWYQDPDLELAASSLQPVPEYWNAQLAGLPDSASIVPIVAAKTVDTSASIRFQHYEGRLPASDYRRLKVLSQQHQIALSVLLFTMIQDIVIEQVQSTQFRLNLLLGNRLPLHPYLGDKADYATALAVLPLLAESSPTFLERAEALSAQVRTAAQHLTTAALPALVKAEAEDKALLPLLIECNLQQGLRQTLLPMPADIVYYNGDDLRVNYQVSMWEQAGDICYRCSMPKGFTE